MSGAWSLDPLTTDCRFAAFSKGAPYNAAWDELKFIDVTKLKREEIARSQVDVLTYAGKLVV